MTTIIIFPGSPAPHKTALALEARGYRIDLRTGRAYPPRPVRQAPRSTESRE